MCGHSEHGGYCPNQHCEPILCPVCKIKVPEWPLGCHHGACMNCAIQRFSAPELKDPGTI